MAVVVAQPRTGTVVAFAEAHSEPAAETWAKRAFAPGFTTKPFVVTAALEAGAVSEDQIFDCQQPYDVGGRTFNNHDPKVRKVSTTEVIAQSVNVCTIKMAQATGKWRLRHTLQHFGLDWKDDKASEGQELSADDAEAVLGMTLPANLAGMIRAYSLLANHGRSLASPSDQVISEKTADADGQDARGGRGSRNGPESDACPRCRRRQDRDGRGAPGAEGGRCRMRQ